MTHGTNLYYDTIEELILGHNGLVSHREPAGIPELQVQSSTYFHWAYKVKVKAPNVHYYKTANTKQNTMDPSHIGALTCGWVMI